MPSTGQANPAYDYETLLLSWQDFFQQAYARDECNIRRQSFEEYWAWVRTFFVTGGAGHAGWLRQVDSATARVGDLAVRERLREQLLTLGTTIAAEWSKDSRCRRIYSLAFQGSPHISGMGLRLQHAAQRDTGDGVELARAITEIGREVDAALHA